MHNGPGECKIGIYHIKILPASHFSFPPAQPLLAGQPSSPMAWLTHPAWTLYPAWFQPLILDLGPHLGYVPVSVLGPPRQDIQRSVVSNPPWFGSFPLAVQRQASAGTASVSRRSRADLGSTPDTAGVKHSVPALPAVAHP